MPWRAVNNLFALAENREIRGIGALSDNWLCESMSDRRPAESFELDGYALFERLLSEKAIAVLRGMALSRRLEREIYATGTDLFEVLPEETLEAVAQPPVLDLMEDIVGPAVQLDSVSVIGVATGCEAGISWHRDPFGSVPRGSEFQKPLCFNLLIYLQDLDSVSGPLRIIPGSHRERFLMTERDRALAHKRERLLFAKSGDAVLLHNNVVHSRSPNLSAHDRLHVSVLYTLNLMRQHLTQSPMLERIIARIAEIGDRRMMRLFGRDESFWARNNCGFMSDEVETWLAWREADRATRGS